MAIDKQITGGILEVPDQWFVSKVDLDADIPYMEISKSSCNETKTLFIPPSLAYYLTTHFCGSEKMRNLIREAAINTVQSKVKEVLGIKH